MDNSAISVVGTIFKDNVVHTRTNEKRVSIFLPHDHRIGYFICFDICVRWKAR